jgi:hypothetical protein
MVTYLPTDLQRRYRAILDEARVGEARVRDADGTNILLLPEAKVRILQEVGLAAANLAAIEELVEALPDRRPSISEYGEWSWLRVFDVDDLREFIHDIREAVIVGVREDSTSLLDRQLKAWRTTSEQADDPLFREILAGGATEADFVEIQRPSATNDGSPRSPSATEQAPE